MEDYDDTFNNEWASLEDSPDTAYVVNELQKEPEEEDVYEDINDEDLQVVNVEDILKKNPIDMRSRDIMQDQCTLAYFIQVLFEGSSSKRDINDDEKMNDIILYLQWITDSADILADRIGQEKIEYVIENPPKIIRSSYNFCSKYTQCKKFYERKNTHDSSEKDNESSCDEHHYVHCLLQHDVKSLINFIKYIVDGKYNLTTVDNQNIYSSIKTICYVTRRMAKEISYIDYYTKQNSEIYHRDNPVCFVKKFKKPYNSSGSRSYNRNGSFDKGTIFYKSHNDDNGMNSDKKATDKSNSLGGKKGKNKNKSNENSKVVNKNNRYAILELD